MHATLRKEAAGHVAFLDDFRTHRLQNESIKLERSLTNLIYAQPRAVGLGDDPLVRNLLQAKGLKEPSFVIKRVAVCGKAITCIGVPARVWHDDDARAAILEVKREAAELRTKCILLPQHSVRGTVRAATAATIARGRRARYSQQDLEAVLVHLREARISTLGDCVVQLSDHQDPLGAVLAMCATGMIEIDRSAPITSATWVSTSL